MSCEYNYDLLTTYAFYDTSFAPFIKKLQLKISHEATEGFQDDRDIIDYLYKSELSHAFNIEDITNIRFDKYLIFQSFFATNTITKCIQLLHDRDLLSCILENNKHSTSNIPNLAPIFFSYHLFFFTNLCLQDFKVTGTINELHEGLILQAINELLYDK